MRNTLIAPVAGSALVLSGCGAAESNLSTGSTGDQKFTDIATLMDTVTKQQQAKKTAHFTVRGSDGKDAVDAKGQFDTINPESINLAMDMPVDGKPMSIISTGKIYYVKSPEFEGMLGADSKPWVKVDTDGSGPMSKLLSAMVKPITKQGDPTKILKITREAGEITSTKTEGGTTHYSIAVDTKAWMQDSFNQAKAMMGAHKGAFGKKIQKPKTGSTRASMMAQFRKKSRSNCG